MVSEMVSGCAGQVEKSDLDVAPDECFTGRVIFYGLACWNCQSVEDFFLTREEAEHCLRRVLEDEPDWTDTVGLVQLDFSGPEPVIEELPVGDAA